MFGVSTPAAKALLGVVDPVILAGLFYCGAGIGIAVLSALAAPILNALSRRNERRADRYALKLTGRPEAFISAMRRLAAQNLAEARPSRLTLWFFHSHPPIDERIERARQLTGP